MADNPKIKKINIANQEYDIEPANSEVLAAEHIVDALGYTPADENKILECVAKSGDTMTGALTITDGGGTADMLTVGGLCLLGKSAGGGEYKIAGDANGNIHIDAQPKDVIITSYANTTIDGTIIPKTDGATALTTANIANNVTTESTGSVLDAYQGKVLQDQITELKAKGRFLSVWNATTGLPETYPVPTDYPYEYAYKSGDYYIVGTVATESGQTNKKPNGSKITKASASASWVVGSTTESNTIKTNDYYVYDNSTWTLVSSAERKVAWSSVTGTPTTVEGYGITDAALDANVVHKGTSSSSVAETIYGKKTFKSETQLDGLLYLEGSTPFVMSKKGMIGLRATNSNNQNLGQINISPNFYPGETGTYGVQMNASHLEDGVLKYNAIRVSKYGPQYQSSDNVMHDIALTSDIVNADWEATTGTAEILNKPEEVEAATVALTGAFDDLVSHPTTLDGYGITDAQSAITVTGTQLIIG